ncbi:hypothetical protein [Massilia sp. Dwa41.01b]|uniref:hypothetical protein n=1 Tax=Massilia sp. Dwa41.01b TaxID=2709302 RepID=UPI001E540637|nr:hypothetical protein [Massilia sp. Dwa41.01b]
MQQIRNKVEQAAAIEDATRRRAELARLAASEAQAAQQACELDEEEHKAQFDLVRLANAARRRAAEREEEWLESQQAGRLRALQHSQDLEAEGLRQQIEALRRAGGQEDAIAQHEKLLRTIDAEARQARAAKEVELLAQERQAAHELARAEALDRVDDTTKLAVAAAPNAAVLADYLKTRVHAGMDAGQLAALAGVVAAGGAVGALDAARLVEEAAERERARRDLEVDKDRAHQLALLALQNEVNKAALGAQAQVAGGVGAALVSASAGARCANGHALAAGERFCAACGAARTG